MSAAPQARSDKREALLDSAERDFEREGFRGISVERLLRENRISTRTLYRHFDSKDHLVVEVLERRHARYLALLDETMSDARSPIDALFDALERWIGGYGTSGCLFLRALGEYGDTETLIGECARRHKRAQEAVVRECVSAALGRPDAALSVQVWLLFEGATAAAGVAGREVVDTAREGARALVSARRAALSPAG